MKIVPVVENAFHESVTGIEEKSGDTKNPHFPEYPEGSRMRQILGKMMKDDHKSEKSP